MLHDSTKEPNCSFASHFEYKRGGRANIHTADCHQRAAATPMESSKFVTGPFQGLSTFTLLLLITIFSV